MSEMPQETTPAQAAGDDEEVTTPSYDSPQPVSVGTVMDINDEDESSVNYPEILLGSSGNVSGKASCP